LHEHTELQKQAILLNISEFLSQFDYYRCIINNEQAAFEVSLHSDTSDCDAMHRIIDEDVVVDAASSIIIQLLQNPFACRNIVSKLLQI
jgi:hypothetical protein